MWGNTMPENLRKHLPDVPQKTIDQLFGSIKLARSNYPMGSPMREGTIAGTQAPFGSVPPPPSPSALPDTFSASFSLCRHCEKTISQSTRWSLLTNRLRNHQTQPMFILAACLSVIP